MAVKMWMSVLASVILVASLQVVALAEEEQQPSQEQEKATALVKESVELLTAKKYEDGLAKLQEADKLVPNHPTILYNMACALSLMGKRAEAVDMLGKAVKAGFGDVEYLGSDSDLDAIRDLDGYKTLVHDMVPDDQRAAKANALLEAGGKLLNDNKPVEALAKLRTADVIMPDNPGILFDVAIALLQGGKVKEASDALDAAVKAGYKDEKAIASFKAQMLMNEGLALMKAKKYDEGVAKIMEAGKLLPGDPNVAYNLACAYSLAGKTDEALKALEASVKAGWKDVEWMEKDTDLDNIRKTDGYKKIVEEIRGKE